MTGKEYMDTQLAIIKIGRQVESLNLKDFLKAISNAETMGPIVDPTKYRLAMDNLAAIKKLAQTLQQVKIAFDETYEAVLKTAVSGFMEKAPSLPEALPGETV